MRKLILAMVLFSTNAVAQQGKTFNSHSDEWQRGWCAAVRAITANRNHYRRLMKFPEETVEESIKRIYESWPPKPPKGFNTEALADEFLNLEMAGIDLYVILPPPKECEEK